MPLHLVWNLQCYPAQILFCTLKFKAINEFYIIVVMKMAQERGMRCALIESRSMPIVGPARVIASEGGERCMDPLRLVSG